jgi:hypothetical protein
MIPETDRRAVARDRGSVIHDFSFRIERIVVDRATVIRALHTLYVLVLDQRPHHGRRGTVGIVNSARGREETDEKNRAYPTTTSGQTEIINENKIDRHKNIITLC